MNLIINNLIKGVYSAPFLAFLGALRGFDSCGCISVFICFSLRTLKINTIMLCLRIRLLRLLGVQVYPIGAHALSNSPELTAAQQVYYIHFIQYI